MSRCVDAHVHLYEEGFWPPAWFDYVARQWAHSRPGRDQADIRGRIEGGLADPAGAHLIEQMDQAGIDTAVLLTVDWELGMESCPAVPVSEVHARYAELALASNGRLVAFAGVDPRRPDALALAEQAFDVHGLAGLKLYPPAGFYPYEEIVEPLYEACAERGIPVVVHTGSTLGLLRPRFGNPLFMQDVQRRYPSLTLWIGHAGATWWWDEAVAVAKAGIDTYLELSSWQSFAYDEEETFVRRLGRALSVLGAEKLLFGSDHISGPRVRGTAGYLRWAEWFRCLPTTARKYGVQVTDDQIEAMLGGNAARCLGLSQ